MVEKEGEEVFLEEWSKSKYALLEHYKFGFTPEPGQDVVSCFPSALMPYNGKLWIATTRGGGLYTLDEGMNLELKEAKRGDKHGRAYHEATDRILVGVWAVDGNDYADYEKELDFSITDGVTLDAMADSDKYLIVTNGIEGKIYKMDMTEFPPTATYLTRPPRANTDKGSNCDRLAVQGGMLIAPCQRVDNQGLYYYDPSADEWTTVTTDHYYGGAITNKDYAMALGYDELSAVVQITTDGTSYSLYRLPWASPNKSEHGHPAAIITSRYLTAKKPTARVGKIFYEFPNVKGGRPYPNTFDPRPIAGPTRDGAAIDFCYYKGLFAYGSTGPNPASNKREAMAQGYLDMLKFHELHNFPKPKGYGGVWRNTSVSAGETSDPFLINGFNNKTIHLETDGATDFTIQVDPIGDGSWKDYDTVSFSGAGYDTYIMTGDAIWVRVKSSDAVTATVWFNLR